MRIILQNFVKNQTIRFRTLAEEAYGVTLPATENCQ